MIIMYLQRGHNPVREVHTHTNNTCLRAKCPGKYIKPKTEIIEKCRILHKEKSRDNSVGIATGYGLEDRMIGVQFPAGDANFSLHHQVQTGSGVYPVSYPMDTRASFTGGKAAGA
jgi:hypothetical protein